MRRALTTFLIAILLPAVARAGPILPTFTTFGSLPAATFGGSGIPNNAVAITTIQDGANTITLGLTATQRFGNPALTNNGAGVFQALSGGDLLNAAPTLAVWNFDFYIATAGGAYLYELLYDFDPAASTDQAALGKLSTPLTTQDSWNLGFAFLASPVSPFLTPPIYASFDPNAVGEYSFALIARNQAGIELGRSAILVNAGSPQPVPEPATMSLMIMGLAGLGASCFRRRRKASVQ